MGKVSVLNRYPFYLIEILLGIVESLEFFIFFFSRVFSAFECPSYFVEETEKN